MIHWLIQTLAAHPSLIRGEPPPELLSPAETAVFDQFTVLKRRQDWLLGRWTTKLLLRELIDQEFGRAVALDSISILAGKDGAPRVHFDAANSDLNEKFSVSISHSHGTSLCAAAAQPDWPLGADIELIEPRAASFPASFFTEEEQAQIEQAPPELREMLVTAVWSGKEAALKAIREGLRSDTRSVSCIFDGQAVETVVWQPFHIQWQREEDKKQQPELNGWYKVKDQFVLTLASKEAKIWVPK